MKLDLDRLTFHRDRSEVSAEQYLGQLKLALHDGIKLRHSVYLDTKFWVNFRKIMLGEKAFGGYAALLDLLRLRVADGTLFCPMSESIFSELCKQDNPTTRAATAALDGSCSTPIAGHATIENGSIQFRGEALTLDGKHVFKVSRSGGLADAAAMGRDAGEDVKARGGSLIAY